VVVKVLGDQPLDDWAARPKQLSQGRMKVLKLFRNVFTSDLVGSLQTFEESSPHDFPGHKKRVIHRTKKTLPEFTGRRQFTSPL